MWRQRPALQRSDAHCSGLGSIVLKRCHQLVLCGCASVLADAAHVLVTSVLQALPLKENVADAAGLMLCG